MRKKKKNKQAKSSEEQQVDRQESSTIEFSSKETSKKGKKGQEGPIDYQWDTKPTFWDVVSPEGMVIDSPDYGIIKQSLGTNTYFRPFFITRDGYPRKMQTTWLNTLTSSGEMDVLIDIHKVPKSEAVRTLQRQVTMLESNLSFQTKRGNTDQIQDLETKIMDTNQLMSEIQFSENDSYNTSVLGVLYGESEKELNRYSERLEDELKGMFFKVATTWSRIRKGFRSALPFGQNEIHDSFRNMDRRALSTFAPFISGSGTFLGGVPIGINRITGQKEFINSFGSEDYRPQNYNMGILGIPGSGKSLAMKMKIARENAGANVYANIIDPEGEFVRITKRLGGINLNISEESDIIINPCAINYTDIPLDEDDEEMDLLEDADDKEIIEKNGKRYIRFVPVREKANELLAFFDIIIRGKDSADSGLDVFERNYLEEAIEYVFKELGITTHPESLFKNEVQTVNGHIVQSKVRKLEPEILQIYEYLVDKYGEDLKAERLIAGIKPFLRTGSKPIFDGQTFLGRGITQTLMASRLVNFNISQMEEGFLKPIAYHVLLNYIWEHFVKNLDNATKKKYVYCDELWQFIDNDLTVAFFEKLARRARKRNCGFCWASQDFVRILEHPKSRGILTSTFSYLFFQQNKIDLKRIKENFDLSNGEVEILFNNPGKGEGIFRVGGSSVWLQTDPSEEEMVFIESNTAVLEELLERRKRQRYQDETPA
ncbi:VirB4 family type IV secretion system protein [Priestia koreensis]|uniref:Helicase HerA central domain-containing protein n=1 Tax=Priestia koreensis TaxID=284581 RepID=A0A0M0LAU4_9BACI|nr:hypothetical protein AMD01_05060 [Priestia koreensis]